MANESSLFRNPRRSSLSNVSTARPPLLFGTAAIISTGSEILQGLYADTNARYLAERIGAMGIEVRLIAAAPDDPTQLERLLRFACTQADVLVCTGGLGPTVDDVNREVFAKVFAAPLVLDTRAIEMMEARFHARGREMPSSNHCQAMVPVGAVVFYNEWGTAPGYFLPPLIERQQMLTVARSMHANGADCPTRASQRDDANVHQLRGAAAATARGRSSCREDIDDPYHRAARIRSQRTDR